MTRIPEFVSHLESNSSVEDLEHNTNGYRQEIKFTIDGRGVPENANLQQVNWHDSPGPYDAWPISEDKIRVVVVP